MTSLTIKLAASMTAFSRNSKLNNLFLNSFAYFFSPKLLSLTGYFLICLFFRSAFPFKTREFLFASLLTLMLYGVTLE